MKTPSSAYISTYNDVTKDNFDMYFIDILPKLKRASHIAIDLEFTGLAKPKSSDMNHRYLAMKKVIEDHSIVSFGISIMKKLDRGNTNLDNDSNHDDSKRFSSSQPVIASEYSAIERKTVDESLLASSPVVHPTIEPKYSQSYECDNYNFLTLKEGPLVFGPGNAQFLVESGFSVDRLIQEGIPFVPPGDIQKENQEEQLHAPVKDTKLIQLWKAILGILKYNNIPLILHNGLHDIMYLYHSFIDGLPKKFSSFVNSVSNHFPSGIYDTKYLAAELNFNATFLSYVFARSDRLRQNRFLESTEKEPYFEVIVNHPAQQQPKFTKSLSTSAVSTIKINITTSTSATKKRKLDDAPSFDDDSDEKKLKKQKKKDVICKAYAANGWCKFEKMGDLDHGKYSRLHDIQHVLDWEMGVSQYPQTYTSDFTQEDAIEGAHSAHFDAYMTAFSFCYFLHTFPPVKLQEKINKIKLGFMEHPLRFPFKK